MFTALILYKNIIELCETHFMHCLPSLSALPCLQLCDSFSELVCAHCRIRLCLPFFSSMCLCLCCRLCVFTSVAVCVFTSVAVCVCLLLLPLVCHCRYLGVMSTSLYMFVLMCIALLVCGRHDITAVADWA